MVFKHAVQIEHDTRHVSGLLSSESCRLELNVPSTVSSGLDHRIAIASDDDRCPGIRFSDFIQHAWKSTAWRS